MFTEKRHPQYLSRATLDDYLANGWYRMGQGIFTCHFLCFGERIYSAIWLRLSLKDNSFRKSLRKLFKRNQQFRTIIRPAKLDKQKEALYQRYRWYCFKGNISTSLRESLLDGGTANIYNTYECCVYDGDKLIAASFFDLGKNSIASILGMYDPEYANYSLGFYTMLVEIKYGQSKNFDYYYPGYIVPGYKRFDYKLRVGDVDYYNVATGKWEPFQKLKEEGSPLERMTEKLKAMGQRLEHYGVSSQLYYYPLFETHLITYWEASYLKYPVFLWCQANDGSSDYLLIVYDLVHEKYMLLQCNLFSDLPSFLEELFEESNNDQPCFLEVLVVRNQIVTNYEEDELAQAIMRLSRMRRLK